MALMDEAVRAVADAAGWNMPEADRDGACHFHLKDDLDFSLFSPDGRVCIVRATVAELPADAVQREELLSEAVRKEVGVCRSRSSVPAVEGAAQSLMASDDGRDKLILFRQVRLEGGDFAPLIRAVKEFLNDLAWWKASFSSRQNNGAERFFSMPNMFYGGGF